MSVNTNVRSLLVLVYNLVQSLLINKLTNLSGRMLMQKYKEIFDEMMMKLNVATEEEDVRMAWGAALSGATGKIFEQEHDKRDMSYNNVFIEFKNKGLFHNSKKSKKFIEAVDNRIKKYVLRASERRNLLPHEFIGIVIDGVNIAFVKVNDDGSTETGNLLRTNIDSFNLVIEAINTEFRRGLSAQNLIIDFGPKSPIGKAILSELYNILIKELSISGSRTELFYEEWKQLYGQVSEPAMWKAKSYLKNLPFPDDAKMSQSLFTINTYNSLLVKLLAAELVSTFNISSFSHYAEHIVSLSDDKVIDSLRKEIELSQYFREAQLNDFVSEVLFSWYTSLSYAKNDDLAVLLKRMAAELTLYNLDQKNAMESGDVLKGFYEGLVPDSLRKSLGEFYTPDWLIEYTLSKVDKSKIMSSKILDPTAGSGSFLIQVINIKRKEWDKKGIDHKTQLKNILKEVYGFDLNPLAVQTGRVNYLFTIIDLIRENPGESIEIPILLSDAVYAPTEGENDIFTYQIGSSTANLTVKLPGYIARHRSRIKQLFERLDMFVNDGREFSDVSESLFKSLPFLKNDDSFVMIEETYNNVLKLHQQNWNGIWFQIIKNFFWSAETGTFDMVVGNPPWVRWSELPELYRERVKPTAIQYNIFSEHKRHGGNELDISALITYTVADKWLNEDGILLFLLPQNHLQNDSSSGFRMFQLGDYTLAPMFVDDLKALKPFPDAVNKTMLLGLRKTLNTIKYPVPYVEWKSVDGKKSINKNTKLSEILKKRIVTEEFAQPIFDQRSPWVYGSKEKLQSYQVLRGTSNYRGYKGITADINGIYFVEVLAVNKASSLAQVRTRPEAGRTDIGPARKVWVETDELYPLIKGASDISPNYFKAKNTNLAVFIPNKGINKED